VGFLQRIIPYVYRLPWAHLWITIFYVLPLNRPISDCWWQLPLALPLAPEPSVARDAPVSAPAPEPSSPAPASYAEAVANAAPSVVNITIETLATPRPNQLLQDPVFRDFFGDALNELRRPERQRRFGSAVIIDAEGRLVTNYHVVSDANRIDLTLYDGRSGQARLIGYDAETDLAVLATELRPLPAIKLANSDELQVGDVVLAIGNPFGVGQAVTQGIVSGTGRNRLGINTFENFIQTDAAINPGNSGGALVNSRGELLGINTAIFSKASGAEGISFAIPINLVRSVLAQILAHGGVVRGWLGIEAQDGRRGQQGVVIVTRVLLDSPAFHAGLQVGDLLLAIGERRVRDARDAVDIIAAMRPGDRTQLTLSRRNQLLSVPLIAGQRPAAR
jgi:S1-C subfamily serine protease